MLVFSCVCYAVTNLPTVFGERLCNCYWLIEEVDTACRDATAGCFAHTASVVGVKVPAANGLVAIDGRRDRICWQDTCVGWQPAVLEVRRGGKVEYFSR